MDAEFLGTRLAAAEAAVLKIDERLDAQPDVTPALAALAAEVNDLKEQLTVCVAQLSSLQTSQSEATETTAEIAEAEADQAQAEATEAIAEVLETVLEMETEEEPPNMASPMPPFAFSS